MTLLVPQLTQEIRTPLNAQVLNCPVGSVLYSFGGFGRLSSLKLRVSDFGEGEVASPLRSNYPSTTVIAAMVCASVMEKYKPKNLSEASETAEDLKGSISESDAIV